MTDIVMDADTDGDIMIRSAVFNALKAHNVDALVEQADDSLRPFLPALYSLSCRSPSHTLLALLDRFPEANVLQELDYCDITEVGMKIQRANVPTTSASALDFEQAELPNRIVMVSAELQRIARLKAPETASGSPSSELLNAQIHVEDLNWILWVISTKSILSTEIVVKALLTVRSGVELVLRMVLNQPLRVRKFVEIIAQLWKNSGNDEINCALSDRCTDILERICALDDGISVWIRDMLVDRRAMPQQALRLSLIHVNDTVELLCGMINEPSLLVWMLESLRKTGPEGVLGVLRALNPSLKESQGNFSNADLCALLRAHCVLLGVQTGAGPNPHLESNACVDELQSLLTYLFSISGSAQGGYRAVKMALCLIISCPCLSVLLDSETNKKSLISWLKSHIDDTSSSIQNDHTEMLLLLAVHFSTGNNKAVADLIRASLEFHVDVPLSCLRRMGDLLMEMVVPENVLVQKVLQLKVTDGLHAKVAGSAPIYPVYHVLNSRLFVKYKAEPAHWILDQVVNVSRELSIHPLITSTLASFADLCTHPHGSALSGNEHPPRQEDLEYFVCPLTGFHENEIHEVLNSNHAVAKSLLLFYVLTFNKALDDSKRLASQNIGNLSKDVREKILSVRPYSQELLTAIPIKSLLRFTEDKTSLCGDLYPRLLPLVLDTFPEFFNIAEMLRIETTINDTLAEDGHGSNTLELDGLDTIRSFLNNGTELRASYDVLESVHSMLKAPEATVQDSVRVRGLLESLAMLSEDDILKCEDILLDAFLPPLIDGSIPRHVADEFLKLWRRIGQIQPHDLWVKTIRRLQPNRVADVISMESLVENPLLMLQCSLDSLRQPPIIDMILTMLKAYMDASSNRIRLMCESIKGAEWTVATKSNLGVSRSQVFGNADAVQENVLLLQNAAIIQLLLEVCTPPEWVKEECASPELQEVHKSICSFIHQLFVQSPDLVRVLHFEGYHARLLDLLALGVPSMHLCMNFIGDMLVLPDQGKQVFAVQIAGALAKRYPVPKMLEVARLVVGKAQDVANADEETRHAFFIPALMPIAELCRAFPLLTGSVMELLLKLYSVELGRSAVKQIDRARSQNLEDVISTAIDLVGSIVFLDGSL